LAQWMMTRKILENWALWIALDVVYVWMFVVLKSLHFTAFQYAVFLLLAMLGLRDWKRSFNLRAAAAVG
ncbi:MAG: nicotinamide mononucleotide transporter, partial [Gemmatimonadaceae bacterium]|nr:nicotinamide mononucleotide transporter [Gemmatimonadaceae bacterium]